MLFGIVSLLGNAMTLSSRPHAHSAAAAALAVAAFGLGAAAPYRLRVCCGSDIGTASAIGSVRAINSGEESFANLCGKGGYAADLVDLAKPPPDSTMGFVSPDLGVNGVQKGEYLITLREDQGATVVTRAADTCNRSSRDAVSSYFVEAHPVAARPGLPSFASDARRVIYTNQSGTRIQPGMAGAVPLQ